MQAMAIHGDLAQVAREKALRRFTDGELSVLVATDVAARGIDIDDIGVVIHYEPAPDGKDYLHRSGRTARAGRDGWAVTLAEYNQHTQVRILQRALRLDVAPPDRGVLEQPQAAQPRRSSTPYVCAVTSVSASQAGRCFSKSVISSTWVSVMPTSSRPLRNRCCVCGSIGNEWVMPAARHLDAEALDVDGDLGRRVGLDGGPDRLDGGLGHDDRDEPVLGAVVAEDVAEARRDDRVEATLLDRPHGVLARRADAEARPGNEDRCAGVALVVEHEVAVVAPRREQALLEAGALDALQPLGGDDLVGVDVAAPQRHPATRDDMNGLHCAAPRSCGGGEVAGDRGGGGDGRGDEVGATAAALAALEVAVAGAGRALALRQLVGVHRQAHAAARLAPVGAGGTEHARAGLRPRPAPSRRGCPARPSLAAPSRSVPFSTAATARRSSMRPLVQLPMNTVSTAMSRIVVPASRPMYSSDRATVSRVVASAKSSGDGTLPSMVVT